MSFWRVPPLWEGQGCVVIGGGPSLTHEAVSLCKGRFRVLAVNNAVFLAPWADALYACDAKWWLHYGDTVAGFTGLKVMMGEGHSRLDVDEVRRRWPDVKMLRRGKRDGLSQEADTLALGSLGGYQAVGLAVHLGANPIILLGFDGKHEANKRHWHGDHPKGLGNPSASLLARCPWETMVEPLRRRGVVVLNATPGSAIRAFHQIQLDEALKWPTAKLTPTGEKFSPIMTMMPPQRLAK